MRDVILPAQFPAPDDRAERVLDAEREHGSALGSHDLALQLADRLRQVEKRVDLSPWSAQYLAPAVLSLVTRIGNHSRNNFV